MTGGNVAVTGNCGILEKGSEIAVLHHRKEKKRTLSVKIVSDNSIGAASQSAGKWTIPMDLVGIEGKKMKNIKVRVHPDVFSMGNSEKFLKSLDKAVRELISSILGADWSLAPVKRADPRIETIRKIRKMLAVTQTRVKYEPESFHIIFPLVGKNKKELKAVEEGSSAIGKGTVLKVATEVENGCSSIKLLFDSGDLVKSLWEMKMDEGYVAENGSFSISPTSLILSVPRTYSDRIRVPPRAGKVQHSISFDDLGNPKYEIMESVQETVEELRRRLDLSLQAYSRRPTGAEAQKKMRVIEVLQKDKDAVVFQIADRAAMDTIHAARRLMRPSSPLNVEVSNIDGDSHGSPAGSVDSGMGDSPASSPKSPPSSPFYKYNENMRILSLRQRSYSESCPGLKGILKWPQARTSFVRTFDYHTRLHYEALKKRSASLCHSDEKEVKSSLSRSPTFEEEMNCSIDNTANCAVTAARMVRRTISKRVSFSEHVEEKVFKKGSSIIGQQSKNDKRKQRKERKRTESIEEVLSRYSSHESGLEHVLENDVFDEPCAKAGGRAERQDSGFCEEEDEKDDTQDVVENPEQGWMRMVRSQRKRWSSESQVVA